jgi:hypothetical protein
MVERAIFLVKLMQKFTPKKKRLPTSLKRSNKLHKTVLNILKNRNRNINIRAYI